MTAWKWINTNCQNTRYVLKVDDDTVINTFALMDFVDYLKKYHADLKNSYFCNILHRLPVERYIFSKYFTTCDEYPKKYFRDFCHGSANFITSDLIPKLHNATYFLKPFWVDDQNVGLITNALRVKMYQINERIVSTKEIEKRKNEFFMFVKNTINLNDIYRNWNLILEKHTLKYNETDYKWEDII